jgi:hypothetical protein
MAYHRYEGCLRARHENIRIAEHFAPVDKASLPSVSQLPVACNNLMRSADSMDQSKGSAAMQWILKACLSACTLLFAVFLLGFLFDSEDAGDMLKHAESDF